MSSIDNRIVEMQFNNKRFEENARETMSTLDKLKDKLNFKNSTKELENFQNAADSFNLNRIANTLDTIGNKFTLMGQIGYQALTRIANLAISTGATLLKSLSFDQIRGGMSKYEEETNVIQTLWGALKPKGYKIEDIYDTMEMLAAYSDETSYSYTQMSDAVSKFVNAGVELTKAETIIEGISNVAALAGINIHETEIIYRNFSDAIGKGKFTLNDWNSIKLAHMDTQWLKEAFIDEAIAQGKIAASERSYYLQNFEETLVKGWLDTDVLSGTMLKYADRELEGFGKEAFAAAQNAKTFTDVLDALKDSISSGWSRTFRIIFGDLDEAIALFTPMANALIEFTSAIDETRNRIFQNWKDFGGRDSIIGFFKEMWENIKYFTDLIDNALTKAFVLDGYLFSDKNSSSLATMGGAYELLGERLYFFTKSLQDAAEAFSEWMGKNRIWGKIDSILYGITSAINIVWKALNGIFTFATEIFKQLSPTFIAIIDFIKDIAKDFTFLSKDISKNHTFEEFAKNLAAIFVPITSRLPKVIGWVRNLYKRLKDFWNNNTKFVRFRKSVEKMLNSFIKFIPKAIDSVIEFGRSFIEMIKNSDEWKALVSNYNKYIRPIIDKLVYLGTLFAKTMTDFFNIDTSGETTLWGKIKKRFSVFNKLGPYLNAMWDNLKKDFPWLKKVEDWWNTNPVIQEIKAWVKEIVHAIDVFLSEDTSGNTSIIGKIKQRFEAMWGELGPWLSKKWDEYKEKFPFLQQIEDFLKPLFGWGRKENDAKEGEENAEENVSLLQRLWNKIKEFVSNIDLGKLALFGAVILILVKVYKTIRTLFGWATLGEKIGDVVESVGDFFTELKKTLKANRVAQMASALIMVAASIWLLGDTLVKLSQLSWEEIGRGLTAMAGLFVEEGAFMIVMTKFNEGPGVIHAGAMIGAGIAMWLLGKTLMEVASLSWSEIGRGLTAMAGLFVEEGAFMIALNRFGSVGIFSKKGASFISLIGIALSMWLLGKTLIEVASLDWPEIGRGLTVMGGLFVGQGAFIILVNRFGSVSRFSKKGASFTSLIGIALSMWLLGKTLIDVTSLNWSEIGRGLSVMGGLFVGQGAFITLVNRFGSVGLFSKKGASFISMLGVALNILILANVLKSLSEMTWEEIGRGLTAMAGLFVEEGAFMVIIGFLNKKDLINPDAVNITTGILAAGIGQMGDAMAKLGEMSWSDILKGAAALAAIEVLLGVFVGVMSKFSKMKASQGISMDAVTGAIWILVQAFIPLTTIESWDKLLIGISALGAVMLALGLFCGIMAKVGAMNLKQSLGILVSAIAMAALMIAFAFALTLIKDFDSTMVLAFAAAMLLVSGAMIVLSKALEVFSKINLKGALIGAVVMIICAAAIAASVAIILAIVSKAIQGFTETVAAVGANLAAYSDQVQKINSDAVYNSIEILTALATAFTVVGLNDYKNLATFRSNLDRLGACLKLFSDNVAGIKIEDITSTTGLLSQMAQDLSGFPDVSDISTSIGNIGGAIKLYSDSVNGIELSDLPDATSIQLVFDTLKQVMPTDEEMTEVASYATDSKGSEMTNFAIGLTNIATAISTFSDKAKGLDFSNIQQAIDALTSINSLNTVVSSTSVKNFGPFAVEVSEQREPLSTFAEDVVLLGTALKEFGDNISTVDPTKLNSGVGVLTELVNLNKALPSTGGISQWITGTQSLTNFSSGLRLLGAGAVAFSQSLGDEKFDAESIKAAGDALIKIVDINTKLPKTGGIVSWFTGDESLTNFSTGLTKLGEGVKNFVVAIGDTKITKEAEDSIGVISRIASIQTYLSNTESWYSMEALASELNNATDSFIELNSKLLGVTTWADTTSFNSLLEFAVDQQHELGDTKYTKNLKDIGISLKDFYNEVWNFTSTWNGGDSGRLDKVTNSIVSIFTTLNDTFTNASTQEGYSVIGENILASISSGFENEDSIAKIKTSASSICTAILERITEYTGKNHPFYNLGTWIPKGLGDGIWDNRYAAINAAVDVMNEAIKAAAEAGGIESPSKEFARLGMYSDMGFAQGLRDSLYIVDSAAGDVSQSALDAVLNDMQAIQNLPIDQFEVNPTIRPVLDTSNISSKAGIIDSLLGNAHTIGFNTSQLEAQAQLLGESTGSDIGLINQQILGLRDQLAHLEETITNIKMVTDTGALVGAMSTKVDKAMGSLARRAERGN